MLETPQNLIPLFTRWCIAQHGLKVTHLFPQTKEQSHVLSSGSKQCGTTENATVAGTYSFDFGLV